ncbi:MAG: hypothetical protein WCB61_14245, partial [Pseudolabrys sp.]
RESDECFSSNALDPDNWRRWFLKSELQTPQRFCRTLIFRITEKRDGSTKSSCAPGVPHDKFYGNESLLSNGAGEGIRTLDPDLGKVVLKLPSAKAYQA